MKQMIKQSNRIQYPNIGFIILASIITCFLVPISSPAIAAALIAGGFVLYRDSSDGKLRGIGMESMAAGVIICLIISLILLFSLDTGLVS